jgi:excisionase family DNA binding protein
LDDLLTTKQLQELLQVDRITIYRMLNDGRLNGFKVGGQWRFSRRDIETWLHEQQSQLTASTEALVNTGGVGPTADSLPLSCIQAIQGVCAEALNVASVTTDLDGTPLAKIDNSSEFCDLILSTAEGRRRCAVAWSVAPNGQPHTCHAGLLCISAPITISDQMVAITSGCQFALDGDFEPSSVSNERIPVLAAELGLTARELEASIRTVRVIPQETLPRICHLVERVAHTFSEIGQERLALLSRLQSIAEMSRI